MEKEFKEDSEIIPVVGERGDGKTLGGIAYLYILLDLEAQMIRESILHREISIIVSNCDINFKNAIYSPFLLMPFSEIQNRHKIILVDDIKSLKNIDGFLTFVGSISRKTNSTIIITAQYEKQIPKELREQTPYDMCRFSWDENEDLMIYEINYVDKKLHPKPDYYYFENCVKTVGHLFKTGQINELPEENALETELIFQSPTKYDLRKNATMLYRDKRERRAIVRKIEEEFAQKRKLALKERPILFPRYFK